MVQFIHFSTPILSAIFEALTTALLENVELDTENLWNLLTEEQQSLLITERQQLQRHPLNQDSVRGAIRQMIHIGHKKMLRAEIEEKTHTYLASEDEGLKTELEALQQEMQKLVQDE